MADRITDELIQSALKQALLQRRPPENLIHHSDRGSQYASSDYRRLTRRNKIIASMSRKGDCWDNAVAESFLHTLKVELVNRYRFRTKEAFCQLTICPLKWGSSRQKRIDFFQRI
jgi:transposase InsO family protein